MRRIQRKYKKEQFSKIIGSPDRELTDEEILNRDYYRGRFIRQTNCKKIVYNWDKNIKLRNIKQA